MFVVSSPPERVKNSSSLAALFRPGARQEIEDTLWKKSAVVLGLRLRPKADTAELIVCAAFHLPPVLCYQQMLDCWEMILAGGETQQDVEREDADRVTAHMGTHAYTPTHARTHTQRHAHIAWVYCLHMDTLPSSRVQWYPLHKIKFIWLIAVGKLAYCKGIQPRKRNKPMLQKWEYQWQRTYSDPLCIKAAKP